jgi:bifunctional isochorismate lyase/aryl carrier protein
VGGLRYITCASLDGRCASWLAELAVYRRGRPLPQLETSALLLVDLQRYFGDPTSHAFVPALDAVLPRCLELADLFRRAGRPVMLTQHVDADANSPMSRWWRGHILSNDPLAGLMPEVRGLGPVVTKASYSAFHQTTLEEQLRAAGCNTLVIAGVATHLCCETTARHAFVLGFDSVVVADGCASFDEDLHLGALRGLSHGVAVVADVREIATRLAGDSASETNLGHAKQPECFASSQLAVIGAGPAGIAAAIQGRRSGLHVTLFDPREPGGWARTADQIENYPGFPGGISGRRLSARFAAQLATFDLKSEPHTISSIALDQQGQGFILSLDDGTERRATAVIVATGTQPRPHRLAGAARADALPVQLKGKTVVVVGGGEAAVDQALAVKRRGAKVFVVARGSFRALPLLLDRARQLEVELWDQSPVVEASPGALTVERGGRRLELSVDHLLVCTGKEPLLPHLPKTLGSDPTTNLGHVPPTNSSGCTTVPGLYLIGDARRGRYRQVAIACGDGVAAAMHAAEFLLHGVPWPPKLEA